MLSDLNITLQFPGLDTGAYNWVRYSIRDLIRVLYILKTTFAFLEIEFLTIKSIIPFFRDIKNETWLPALNVSSKYIKWTVEY